MRFDSEPLRRQAANLNQSTITITGIPKAGTLPGRFTMGLAGRIAIPSESLDLGNRGVAHACIIETSELSPTQRGMYEFLGILDPNARYATTIETMHGDQGSHTV
ncbi:MAG: hypothetical protein OXR66_02990 [Candidatus Woesearchaeota archaeon]|nr:hypothetical protein [Candidatus Woesearchaeota archaeon]